jgi:hypothetical protein
VINIAEELRGYDHDRAYARIQGIGATTKLVLETADRLGITTEAAAEHVAEERLRKATEAHDAAG